MVWVAPQIIGAHSSLLGEERVDGQPSRLPVRVRARQLLYVPPV